MIAFYIMELLQNKAIRSTSELELQDGIAQVLQQAGVEFIREARLSDSDRPDFMVGRVAIEVKTGGSKSALCRQLMRYAAHQDVDEILVITSRFALADLPQVLNCRPVAVLVISGAFVGGVSRS
ncbi:MAG: hypothetical protein WC655_27785 [Candidatus Hydrogenedentales bacterium]